MFRLTDVQRYQLIPAAMLAMEHPPAPPLAVDESDMASLQGATPPEPPTFRALKGKERPTDVVVLRA